jgi:hypothetical protein
LVRHQLRILLGGRRTRLDEAVEQRCCGLAFALHMPGIAAQVFRQ